MDIDDLDKLTACPDCDLMVERVKLIENQQAHCPRCNSLIYQGKTDPVNKTLVVSASGLMMIFPAYFFPIMNMEALGIYNSASVISTISPMMNSSFWIAGLGLLLFAVLFPVLILVISFWISLHLKFRLYPNYLKNLQKFFQSMVRWGMPEVYVLGILVSYIKLLDDFTVAVDTGLICFTLMMLCSLMVTTTVSRQYFWDTLHHG